MTRDEKRCCEMVRDTGGFNSYQCSRRAVVTAPSGNRYCKQHDPEAAKARRVEARKKEQEKMIKWERETLAMKIGLIMVEAGVDTEEKARAMLESKR